MEQAAPPVAAFSTGGDERRSDRKLRFRRLRRNGGSVILPNTCSSFLLEIRGGRLSGRCFQRQSASLIFTPLILLCPQTPCSLFWKFPGFFREQLLLVASQKAPPPRPPTAPPHHPPWLGVCLLPCLLAGPHVILKSSTPSSSWTITQKFTPAQNWLHNSAYCVQRWKHFQSDRPEPLEPLKKENCGGKKNNFGHRLSFFPCGSF